MRYDNDPALGCGMMLVGLAAVGVIVGTLALYGLAHLLRIVP